MTQIFKTIAYYICGRRNETWLLIVFRYCCVINLPSQSLLLSGEWFILEVMSSEVLFEKKHAYKTLGSLKVSLFWSLSKGG